MIETYKRNTSVQMVKLDKKGTPNNSEHLGVQSVLIYSLIVLLVISGQKMIRWPSNTIIFITEMMKSAEALAPFMAAIVRQK